MPVPYTKIYVSDVVSDPNSGYSLVPDTSGVLSQTQTTFPYGTWVAGISDLNGDGLADIVTGGPGDDDKATNAGRIYVNFGLASGGTTQIINDTANSIIIDGVNAGDLAGSAVGSVHDINGDGKSEILVGAPMMKVGTAAAAGTAFVLWGRASGGIDLADPFSGGGSGYAIKGQAAGDHAGQSIASISDLNGDGKYEILVGAAGNDAGGSNAGAAYVVWGKTTASTVSLTTVAGGTGGFKITGEAAGDDAGVTVTSLADENGDGKGEIVVGADGNDSGGADAGAVYVVFGKSTGTAVGLSTVAAGTGGYKIVGQAGDGIGTSVSSIGDVNGDGHADLLITTKTGDADYVVYGKADTSTVHLSDVAAGIGGFMILAETPGGLAGAAVTGGADFNQDGIADFVIGAPHDSEGGFDAGTAYIVWGGAGAPVDLAMVAQGAGGAKIVGSPGSLTGAAVAIAGDMSGDGRPELILGSPGSGESVNVVYASDLWQPDNTIYGTGNDDVMGAGFGGLHKIDDTDNNINGLAGNDTISAGGGNDIIDGGTGADTMSGGSGDDTYYVDDTGDTVVEASGGGTDTVVAAIDWTLGANAENLVLDGYGLSGTGNSLANTITGTDGSDFIDGAGGADSMAGGYGDDTYVVGTSLDVVTELDGGGNDTIIATRNWTLGANIENLVLSGAARIGTGNALDNTLTGTAFSDKLNGGAGADTMIGGAGDDTYLVDNASDQTVEDSAGGYDTVVASVNYVLGDNIEALQLSGAANSGVGNALDNHITGTSHSDMLDGGAGADTLTGGTGNDTYAVDNAGDVVVEAVGGGTDTVNTTLDGYVLAANVERLYLVGDAHHGFGNDLNNTMYGNAGNDVLDGGGGADSLHGGVGDDTYVVTAGDKVYENAGEGNDTVMASVSWTLGANTENLILTIGGLTGTGNSLDNVLTGSSGSDHLNGGAGNDTLVWGRRYGHPGRRYR